MKAGSSALDFVATILLLLAIGTPPAASAEPIRMLIAGDSTASDYPAERAPQTGWGQALPWYLQNGIEVVNRAVSGRSTKSYIDEGKWAALLAEVRSGDVVLISFGHNDSRDDAPERYTAPAGAFQDNLVRFARDIQARDAMPVILSPASRRLWEGPAMVETHGLYRLHAELAAQAAGVDYIDLASLSLAYFETLGREETKQDFLWLTPKTANARFPNGVEDNTHFSELGACGVARIVAIALSDKHPDWNLLNPETTKTAKDPEISMRPPDVHACQAAIERP